MLNQPGVNPRESGREGGLARASRLAEERKDIARRAAQKRWGSAVLPAQHAGDLTIGDLTLACAVVEDGNRAIRVINQATMLKALGRSAGRRSGMQARSCSPPTCSRSSPTNWPRPCVGRSPIASPAASARSGSQPRSCRRSARST